jgi:hypothetical protein
MVYEPWGNNMEDSTSPVLDLLEEFVESAGWNFSRVAESTLKFERVGVWSSYVFYVVEQSNGSISLTSCFVFALTKKLSIKQKQKVYQLLNLINGDMGFGTLFLDETLSGDRSAVGWSYRFVPTEYMELEGQVLEDLLDTALLELDLHYQSFQVVTFKDWSVEKAYNSAIPREFGRA